MVNDEANGVDSIAHRGTYDGFISVVKWSTLVIAVLVAAVVAIVAS